MKYALSGDVSLLDPNFFYHTLIDILVYLTITGLDIAYDLHVVIQFVVSPTTIY